MQSSNDMWRSILGYIVIAILCFGVVTVINQPETIQDWGSVISTSVILSVAGTLGFRSAQKKDDSE